MRFFFRKICILVTSTINKTFVLVHGACHGAWCWFKLACLLQGSGHRVSCIDLAGALVDPNNVRSFDEYDAPLIEFMAALPDAHKVMTISVISYVNHVFTKVLQ